MIGLPLPPSMPRLMSFWVSITLFASILLVTLLYTPFTGNWFFWFSITLLILNVIGWQFEKILINSYLYWNALTIKLTRYGHGWVILIVLMLLTVVGKFGNRLNISSRESLKSIWFPVPSHDLQKIDDRVEEVTGYQWVINYFRWCRSSQNWWAIWLLPNLLILSILNVGKYRSSIPKDTYTLY
jgi:hypothetical protein